MSDCITSTSSNLDLNISLDKLLEAIEQFNESIYKATNIFLGNPFDLIKIDMNKIPRNCYFISNHNLDLGKMYKVKEGELKRNLYKFIEEHPDRVFRGKKYN